MVNAHLLKHRDAATRIQEKYNEQSRLLRDNEDLSDEGRSRQLAELYAKTQRDLNRLAETERSEAASRRKTLESQLYSSGRLGQDPASHAISMRDAADRAAMLETPEQAGRLMRDAEANGDTVLARAILRRVVERPSSGARGADEAWTDVARDYVDRHGEVLSIVEELAEIEALDKREVFSPFTAQPPQGVAPSFINAANGAAMAEARG